MKPAGGKRRGRSTAQGEEPREPAAKPAAAKRTKRLVARASPTARVIESAGGSGALFKSAKPLAAAPARPTAVKDVWSFEEAHCMPKPAAAAPKATEVDCELDAPLSVFELAPAVVTACSPASANMPPLASVFARVPPKPVPTDVADTAVHAARAAGAELAGAPGVGTVPRGCLIEPLPASTAACEPFCALSQLLAACPPEEEEVAAVAAAPVAAPQLTVPRAAAAAVPARPPRAHSPDLFSDSDSDEEWQRTQAVEAAAAPASSAKPVAVPAPAPPPPASAAPPPVRKAVAVGAEQMAWSAPHALAALMLRCDPFLSELGALLCA